MNRKQKKELRQRQSTRQLMGIVRVTPYGIVTDSGERVFFLIQPDNLSVLSPEVIRGRVRSLTMLLSTQPTLEILALDSRESFQRNKEYYLRRLEEETEPAVRELLERAKALNSERVVLAAPGGVSEKGTALSGLTAAAAVAGAIAGQGDPAVPLGGAELLGLNGLSTQYGDNDIDLLVRGGVTPLDSRAGTVSVVRGITTRTRSGESEDATWRELSTVLIVDDVIPAIRESLRARFRRAKNTEQSRGAIRSQVVLELENKKAREIITGYDGVTVTALPENPTVCLVEFAFTVAHGLNQIWLTASITI